MVEPSGLVYIRVTATPMWSGEIEPEMVTFSPIEITDEETEQVIVLVGTMMVGTMIVTSICMLDTPLGTTPELEPDLYP